MIFILFNQFSFGMNESQSFPFTQLDLGVQCEIMHYEHNKTNLRLISKFWSEQASIKSPTIFKNNFCNTDKKYLVRVLLHAAYVKNYTGVENILKNSSILADKDQNYFYNYFDTTYTLNDAIYNQRGCMLGLADVIKHNKDTEQFALLKKYNIPTETVNCSYDIDLVMACLAGNSDAIQCNVSIKRELYLTIAVDCDHDKCIKALLNPLLCDTSIVESLTWASDKYLQSLLNKDIIIRAINKKKLNALDALLSFNIFDINTLFNENDIKILCPKNHKNYCVLYRTLLEHVMRNNKNNQHDNAIALLKKYGAKTLAEIESDKDNQGFAIRQGCIIS